jgi:hypothetical protein
MTVIAINYDNCVALMHNFNYVQTEILATNTTLPTFTHKIHVYYQLIAVLMSLASINITNGCL